MSFAIIEQSDGAAGDWSRHAEYYFRPAGSLAFFYSELRTIYGGVREERRLYFDGAGKRLRESRAVFDLHSGKPAPAKHESYQRNDAPIYRSVAALMAGLPPGRR